LELGGYLVFDVWYLMFYLRCALARESRRMQKHTARMAGLGRQRNFENAFIRFAVMMAWLCCAGAALAANVTATVDRSTIQLGEAVTLSISFEGANAAQPQLPAIPGFQVVGTGSTFSFDSTRGTAQQTFTYQLAPAQPGDFTIPAMQFNIGGQRLLTQPIPVKVVKPGQAVTAPGATAPSAFVKLVTPKSELYVGELSEVTVQVFFQEGRLTQYPQLPTDSGFTVGKWLKPAESRVNISNQLYGVFVFKQLITPVKAGALALGPATVSLFVPDRARQADFFFGRSEREVRMATEKKIIQVLPIPNENVPPTFAGAVGSFDLTVAAAPTNVAAGDPITVRVQIRGRGALDAIQLPQQPDWNEFKTYPPTSRVEGADANNTSGAKTFEQVVVPERAGIKVLPPLAFSFFDPDQKTFRTLTGPLIALNVSAASGAGSALPNLPGTTNAAPAQPASDLAHIKPYLAAVTSHPLLLAQPWFLGVQLVPPIVWVGLLLNRKRRERLANDPKLRRRHEVHQKVRLGLAELRTQAAANNSEAFFALVLRMLQEQIGERVDSPPNAITEAVIDERLHPLGASSELCAAVQELFQMCNLARYAPVKSSEGLSAVVPKVEQTLRELQRWEPAPS
jgi:hypothetical protein